MSVNQSKNEFKPFSAFDYEPQFIPRLKMVGITPACDLPIVRFKAVFAGDYSPSFVAWLREKEQLRYRLDRSAPAPVVVEERPAVQDFKIALSKLEMSRGALGHFEMHYKDADGKVTYREITLKRVFRKGDIFYFKAYCHLRSSIKTFRADRVLLLEDLDNNMIFESDFDVFFAAKLLQY